MAMPRAHSADAMPMMDPIDAAQTSNRALVDRECDCIALAERNDLGPRLHPRTLLGQHELAAREIALRPREQDGGLDREYVLPVEILMEAVVVVGPVFQQERSRTQLTRRVAAREEAGVFVRKRDVEPERFVPAIGGRGESWVERRAQPGDEVGQGIGEEIGRAHV